MPEDKMGYVKKFLKEEGYGFCEVHGLEGDNRYTDVFFHISEIEGYDKVCPNRHVLFGKVSKNEKGWKMASIRASHDPDAWNRR